MGVYLSEPNTHKEIKEGNNNGIIFCKAEMQGWRKSMEDAAIHQTDLGDRNALFGVFDGHGGTSFPYIGHQVSKFVAERFTNKLTSLDLYKKGDYVGALDQVFRLMDELICSQESTLELNKHRNIPESDPISKNTGCTANVVLITPTEYIIANAGDSRSSLCRGGKAFDLSFDHKPESQEEERRIRNAGGQVYMGRVNGGLNLTRSFGDFDYKARKQLGYHEQMITCKPDIKRVQRSNDDQFIILGCDGIWQRYVDNSQGLIDLINTYSKNSTNRKLMEDLLDELLAKDTVSGMGCDNMTAILVKLH